MFRTTRCLTALPELYRISDKHHPKQRPLISTAGPCTHLLYIHTVIQATDIHQTDFSINVSYKKICIYTLRYSAWLCPQSPHSTEECPGCMVWIFNSFFFFFLSLICFSFCSQVKEEMLFEALTTRKTVTVGERLIVPYKLAEVRFNYLFISSLNLCEYEYPNPVAVFILISNIWHEFSNQSVIYCITRVINVLS